MSYILLLDTSAESSVVAICKDGVIVSEQINTELRNHASAINNMIEEAAAEAGIGLSALAAVAVCLGPGSYTGVRIAMATAKGLCYSLGIPMLAHDRLYLMSLKERKGQDSAFASVLTARKGEYYVSLYNENFDTIVPPTHVFEVDLANVFENLINLHITTDAEYDLENKLKVNFLSISTNITVNYHTWAAYAFAQFELQQFCNIGTISPLYIKEVYIHK
jgi:tRNA threonylcarbamoyladenosine biosynthesis protein TsaB